MSPAQRDLDRLRHNIAAFAEALKNREQKAEKMIDRYTTQMNKWGAETERDAYRGALHVLHIWTDGEFGVENAGVTA
ncbi:hypothetical protein VSH64_25035 [Amycolatopsis rhabdoformis]|uniref:Uncharacterized protein n=1 Tax=Amycolatopsis rhabdoformis TaxID=1448059 RepID=A0ABZ1HV38_9PSEU|nr:hypothetical protein [Amycolatopsis rhabdoformis]WSE26143.1 hypothetical protein VSH64_25035 [Amycolatopsis rhabdoformis]